VCIDKCHIKAAHAAFKHTSFDVQDCETTNAKHSCRAKFNTAAAKLVAKGVCPACLGAVQQAALADQVKAALDTGNGASYCAGTAPLGGDDTGFIPPDTSTLTCEETTARNALAFAQCIDTCRIKAAHAAAKGTYFDVQACETTDPKKSCRVKYAAKVSKLTTRGICPACLGTTQQTTVADQIGSTLSLLSCDVCCAGTVSLP
jgi:hypothetical protein